jgi:hypothetical protein
MVQTASEMMMANRQVYQGALHLHTDLSHDGRMSFDELTSFLKEKGYQFMTITEHSYDVTQEQMDEQARMADAATTEDFLVLAGIEFRCRSGIDILGLGVHQTTESEEMSEVIDHILAHNGVAIFAHPGQRAGYVIEKDWVNKLDGAELYNLKEGKLLPQLPSLRLCRMMLRWKPSLNIHFGLDLHRPDGFLFVSNDVFAERNDRESILKALRQGEFTNTSRMFNVGSDGRMGLFYYAYVILFRYSLNTVRWLRDLLHI